MQALVNQDGRPLEDAEGTVLRKGATVRDDIFGNGIATGTVPCVGGGVNVTMLWLGVSDDDRPVSRGAQHLTVVYAPHTGTFHTGAAFEAGAVATRGATRV